MDEKTKKKNHISSEKNRLSVIRTAIAKLKALCPDLDHRDSEKHEILVMQEFLREAGAGVTRRNQLEIELSQTQKDPQTLYDTNNNNNDHCDNNGPPTDNGLPISISPSIKAPLSLEDEESQYNLTVAYVEEDQFQQPTIIQSSPLLQSQSAIPYNGLHMASAAFNTSRSCNPKGVNQQPAFHNEASAAFANEYDFENDYFGNSNWFPEDWENGFEVNGNGENSGKGKLDSLIHLDLQLQIAESLTGAGAV